MVFTFDSGIHQAGSGRPLALAHGAAGTIVDNFTDIAGFLPHRHVFGIDYPGSGTRRAEPAVFGRDAQAEELVRAGHALGYQRFPILGYSLGTTVAMAAALNHPESVSGLVLLAGFALSDVQLTTLSHLFTHLATTGQHEQLGQLLTLNAFAPAVLEQLGSADEQVEFFRNYFATAGDAPAVQMAAAAEANMVDAIGQISAPTLVIVAGQDRIVLPSSTRALGDLIPGAHVVELPELGHGPTPADAQRIAALIDDFAGAIDRDEPK